MPFLVRQELGSSLIMTRSAANIQKKNEMRREEAEHRKFDFGYYGDIPSFVRVLKVKYPNSLHAWRQEFKADVLLPVSFSMFSIGCRKVGYGGHIQSLWK